MCFDLEKGICWSKTCIGFSCPLDHEDEGAYAMSSEVFAKMITDMPEADIPFKGMRGWLLQGTRGQVVFFDIEPVGEVPEHSHGEQWGIVIEGELSLVIDGVRRVYRKGDHYHIPAGALHSATFSSPCKVIDFFADVDRYRPKGEGRKD
jgi:quercetin dioxygenase-like cupin family protein